MGVGPVPGNEVVGLGNRLFDVGRYVVTKQDPNVVFFNLTVKLVGGFEEDFTSMPDFLGGDAGNQPAVANPANPPRGCVASLACVFAFASLVRVFASASLACGESRRYR